jgi:hypothetical protein
MDLETGKKYGKYMNIGIIALCLLSMASGYTGATLLKVGMILLFIIAPLQCAGLYFGVSGRDNPTTGTRTLSKITDLVIFVYFLSMGSVFFTLLQVLQWASCEWGMQNYGKGYDSAKKFFQEHADDPDNVPEAYRD